VKRKTFGSVLAFRLGPLAVSVRVIWDQKAAAKFERALRGKK
jgi:hypothetical protein